MSFISIKVRLPSVLSRANKLLKALGDIAGDFHLKKDLAEFTKAMVYKRVKSGKGVNSSVTPFELTVAKRLNPLSKNYRKYRETYGRSKLGGEFASPKKSNLTMTGQMLKSLTYQTTQAGFKILIPETRRREGKLTNAKLAKYVALNGRPFMNLTAGESRIVKSRLKREFQKRLKRLL